MADLAVLGLQIESDGAVKAANDLDKLSASATKAERATDSAGKASEQASMRMTAGSKAVERLLAAIEKVERAVHDQNAALGNMSGAMARVEAQMEAASKAARGVSASVSGAGTAAANAASQLTTMSGAGASVAAGLAATATGAARMSAGLQAANQNVRLSGDQLRNLSFQANDAITMLASGSSVFQVFATQAGQVFQVFQEGGGIGQNLKAVGSMLLGLLTPLNLAVAGFAALGAGVIYFAQRGQQRILPLTDAMKAHKSAMDAVADSYGVAAGKADKFQRASAGAVSFMARQSRAQLELSARSSLRESFSGGGGIMDAITGDRIFGGRIGGEGRAAVRVFEQFKDFEQPLLRLLDGLATGTARADKFVDEVAKIANMQPANEELQKAAKRLIDMAAAAADAQRQLNGLAPAFLKAAENAKRFRELAANLGDFIPDNRTDAQRIEETFDQMMRLAKTEADVARAQDLRRLSLEGLAEVETRRRNGYDLDVRAITARSAAERAQIEYERTYADVLAVTNDKAQAARQAEEARSLTMQQAAYQQTEAMNDRIRAGQAQVDQLQLEIDTFGKSAGEIARLTTETQLLTAAREAARQAGGIVDPAEEQAIRDQAAAIGELTDRQTQLNLGRDQEEGMRRLQAEAGLIHLNADARRVALAGLEAESELRRQGIPLNETWGQTYVENARNMASFKNSLDKQQEAFEGLRDAAGDFFSSLSSGKGILESFVGAFAQLGNKLASQGFEKLVGGLFGDAGQRTSVTGAIAPVALQAAAQITSTYQASPAERTFAAPVAAVERRVLPSLTSFSKELDIAAKAIRTIESGSAAGNYSALGPVTRNGDRAYGAYQVMGNNIADWSRSAIGREVSKMEFLRSVELQDKIFEHRFGGYMQKYGPEGASRAWFAGEGGMRNYKAQDVVGTSVSGYGGRFGALYNQHLDTNVASSTNDTKVIARGVSTGVVDANRQMASSGDPWAGLRTATGRAQAGGMQGGGLFGGQGMGLIGAGLGSFASGYQSGSPIGGGLGGALSGFAAGGPVGAIIGGLAGLAGGIFGGRAQRKQEHKDKAAAWEQMRPQYEAFDQSLSGEGNGQLRQWITSQEAQFAEFRKVGGDAWKYGQGNSSAQFASTGTKMWTRFMEMQEEFREGFTDMVEDLSSGEGLGGAFAKGRAATKDLKKQIKDMIDDVSIAFGSDDIGVGVNGAWTEASKAMEETRNKAIAEAKVAAGEYALSLLYTAETTSDVEKSLDGFRGTAAGLQKVLTDLGWTAEAAAADIDDRLKQAIAKMGETFVDGFQQQINDLSGKGYLNDIADLVKNRDTSLNDAKLLGVDPSIVTKWFELALQDIVSNADLTAQALEELKKKFPELAKVALGVTSKMQADFDRAVSDRAEAESLLRAEYERTVDRIKSITDFLSDIALDDNLSTLSGKEQFDAAQKAYRETLFKANGGDREAQDKLLGVGQDYLDEAKAYYATSEAYGAVYAEINSTLKASASKMETELDVARRQASFLEDIATSTKGLSGLLADFLAAQSAVDKAYETINGNRNWGAMADQNKAIIKALSGAGIQYSGNFGGGQFLEWITQQSTKQQAIIQPIVDGIVAQFAGKSFALGGYTGPGGVNEFAGMVHRGEVVWNQRDVAAWGGPARVDAMRVARMPDMPISGGRDDGVRAEIQALRSENAQLLRLLIGTTGGGLQRVAVASEEGSRNSKQAELTARRAANNKQAA